MNRFYEALLRLYPAGFRAEYRHQLRETFAERTRGITGPLATPRIALAAIADVVPNALAIHWEILRQDLRYAIRSLARTPGFAITAILVVALGVGANAAAFSLADFVLLRPLSFPDPDRLVRVWQTTPGYGRMEFSPANYRDAKAATRSFTGMAAHTDRAMNLVGAGEPRRLRVSGVTPDLMGVLGVPALAGRVIAPEDSANGQVLVLSYGLWQTQFGGDPHIVGKAVRLDDSPFTIIGVMPESFVFPNRSIQSWTPLILDERRFLDRNDNYLEVVARLSPDVTIDRARADVKAVAAQLERQFPKANEKTSAIVVGFRDDFSQRARLLVVALCGASLCILLLACANLASLLLARATHRSRELTVRAALGAGRERLVRQLVTESLGLASLGGIVGLAVAMAGLPLLARLVPNGLPVAQDPSIDVRALALAAILVVLTGLAFGVGPAIVAGRSKALDALRGGARGGARTQRIRAVLVIVEVAASVVLLVSSGLLIRAVLRIQSTDPGFVAENVLTIGTELPSPRYDLSTRREELYRRVLQDVRALPGVEYAAYTTGAPMNMRGGIWPVSFGGGEVIRDGSNTASLRFVTPQYFAALGIPLRAGRAIAESDTRTGPAVAVISASLAQRHWPNESPLGKRFNFAMNERTVVGVVGDVRVRGLEIESEPQVYLPTTQLPDSSMIFYRPKELVVRSRASTATLVPAIRRIIAAADPEQPISSVRSMTEIISNETASRVTQLRLLAMLSAIALLISGLGIHGLLAFAVSQRSRELGVRRALGEQAGSILRRVVGEGLWLATAGVAIGVFVAYLAARAMGALLAGVQPGDPVTIVVAAGLCFVTAIAGCVRPAVRASRVDPISALRGD
jgi:predicted permease